jgi:GDP-mannose 6-dehydrogenase
MDISIFGIGYVGAVSAACLARDGNTVVAVDVSPVKVADLNAGHSPIVEPGLAEIIAQTTRSGRLRATESLADAVASTELSLVCVGTPSRANGSLDISYAERVAEQLGQAIADKAAFHSVVFRSTVLPGTMDDVLIPILERASGKRAGIDFGVGYYPEFLRESTAIKDYDEPGVVVFGRMDDLTIERLTAMQPILPVRPTVVSIKEAEAIKYVNNAWHALKISFANEIGNICGAADLDSHVVMDILCADKRLNISPAYLRPGYAYGGSCLPKDLRALRFHARSHDVQTPVLDATQTANEIQIDKVFRMVEAAKNRRIGLIGLSFKADTDDLRESPLVILAEKLIGRGYDVKIFDPNIRMSRLTGTNLAYVTGALPHFPQLLCESVEDATAHGETLVLAHRAEGQRVLDAGYEGKTVIDLVRVRPGLRSQGAYQGLGW